MGFMEIVGAALVAISAAGCLFQLRTWRKDRKRSALAGAAFIACQGLYGFGMARGDSLGGSVFIFLGLAALIKQQRLMRQENISEHGPGDLPASRRATGKFWLWVTVVSLSNTAFVSLAIWAYLSRSTGVVYWFVPAAAAAMGLTWFAARKLKDPSLRQSAFDPGAMEREQIAAQSLKASLDVETARIRDKTAVE